MKSSRKIPVILILLIFAEAASISTFILERGAAERRPFQVALDWASVWGGRDLEYAKAVAFHQGAIYVTGSTTSFGSGRSDIFLLKYGEDGRLIWNRTWGGSSYDTSWNIAAADDGIYVMGSSYVGEKANAALLKYDFDGNVIWVRKYGGEEDAVGRGVAIDEAGSVYVAGYLRGTLTTKKSFQLKYTSDGDLIWNRTWGEEGVYAFSEAVGDGIYAGGTSESLENGGWRSEMLLEKFDEAGDILWNRRWGSNVENYGWAISASGGEIYQVGATVDESGNADAVLLMYDLSGDLTLNCTWGGHGEEYAWGVARGDDYLYVVGHALNETQWNSDALVIKYAVNGTPLWAVTWGGSNTDLARSVVVDGSSIYVSGITYSAGGDGQSFLLKYSSPNEAYSPVMNAAVAVTIAVGLIIWTVMVLVVVHRISSSRRLFC